MISAWRWAVGFPVWIFWRKYIHVITILYILHIIAISLTTLLNATKAQRPIALPTYNELYYVEWVTGSCNFIFFFCISGASILYTPEAQQRYWTSTFGSVILGVIWQTQYVVLSNALNWHLRRYHGNRQQAKHRANGNTRLGYESIFLFHWKIPFLI